MRKFIIALTLAAALGSAGCRTSTEFGSCKGLFDQEEKNPALVYEVSTRNVVLAVIFSASLLWPVLTGGFWLYCPTGKK